MSGSTITNPLDFELSPTSYDSAAFVPAEPRRARTLTAEQVAHYNEHGYVSGLPIFDEGRTAEVARYVLALIDDVVAADDRRNSYSVNTYHIVCAGLWDLVTTSAILDHVEDILGPDFVCWGSHAFCKMPADPREVPWHQDAIYWPFTSPRTVTAWLSIDGADEENGAMAFAPGSHLLGPLPHRELELDGTRVLKRALEDPDRFTERVANVMAAGSMSLHADLLVHGSSGNRSAHRRRTGFTIRYAAAEVDVLPGYEIWKSSAVHCRGAIPSHWPHVERPQGEHPELMASFTGDFDGNRPDAG